VSIAGNSDGSILCAAANWSGGATFNLYLSTDSGTTWTETSSLTTSSIYQVAMSINGNKIAVTGTDFGSGGVYVTQNGGTTWSIPAGSPSGTRTAIAMTPDGKKLVLGGIGYGTDYLSTAVGT
jgi:photosystem II stability/assembly factor-like uncharacterized protein